MSSQPSPPPGPAAVRDQSPGARAVGIKAAGIKDVAARAGVSLKTVTNVVHERPNVAAPTRARVLAAISELDYRPSQAGRLLQSGRSNVVTLAVPRINEPYLGALAHALIAAARPRGLTLLIDETAGRPEREAIAAGGYPGHSIDGVIFEALDAHQLVDLNRSTPMVLLGERIAGSTADHVAIDDVGSARDVVAHLVKGGRRRMGFLGHQPHTSTSVPSLRYAGFRQELHATGLDAEGDWHVPTRRYDREEGEARTEATLDRLARLPERPPVVVVDNASTDGTAEAVRRRQPSSPGVDALVCASDLLAIGAMRALRRHGLRVPEDIAVVGWDDTVDAAYHHPGLTSVAPELAPLAERTLDVLVGRINGLPATGTSHVVPHRLVVRESSRPRSARPTR